MNILWLHDNINDHKQLDKQLNNFEKPIKNLTDDESCVSFLTTSEQQNDSRPSLLIVLNRIARQIVPEIHSCTTLLYIIIFCTKDDNKIKWARKYNKIRGVFINTNELLTCARQLIKKSGLVQPFSCQLVLLDDHPNEIAQQQLYRLDSNLIVFKRMNLCLDYLRSCTHSRSLILITVNSLGRQIVPEIYSNKKLKAIFIYCNKRNEKVKWTTKYDKIKLVTMNILDLINNVKNEGVYHSDLLWHLVCLDDCSNVELRDRLYELDPCILTFDRFDICEKYLDSVKENTIAEKPILFIAINSMGRQFIPEIHSNDRLNAFYIFVSSDSINDKKIKWTTKYNKIKRVCTNLNQLIAYITQDAALIAQNIIQNCQNVPLHLNLTLRERSELLGGPDHMVCIVDCSNDTRTDQVCTENLRCAANSIRRCKNVAECVDFFGKLTDETVSLIILDKIGRQVVPLIHEASQLRSIYDFCGESKSNDEGWSTEYEKVRGVFTEMKPICEALSEDIRRSNQDSISISFVSSFDTFFNANLDQLDPLFMYSQLLKEILLEMEYDETAKREFVNFYREQFVGNAYQLKVIDDFEREYHSHPPVYWYTRNIGIYSMLNRALRTQTTEIIIKMGFFIRDLHFQISRLHSEQFSELTLSTFIVYRGQSLLQTHFEHLMKTRGGLMSFNNFLSTSKDRSISFLFAESAQSNPDSIGVLFQIKIDPSISSAPFASIHDESFFQGEEEILFSMHTVFRIGEISQIQSRLWQVDLTLTSDNDQQLQALAKHTRHNIEGGTGLQRLGALMLEMGEYDKAREVYETLLSMAHPNEDRRAISSVHNQLGAIYSRKGDMNRALAHYNISLEMKLIDSPPNDQSLSPILSNIGSVFRNQNQLNTALEYMERALNIELQASHSNPLKIASYRNNIGLVLTDQNRYDKALAHYEKALEIQQQYLPPNHPDLATSHNNIGTIYNELQDYSKALSYYEKSLEIMQRSLPPNHPDLAIPYNNLGAIYNELQDYCKALSFYEKSLNIIQQSLPSNHSSLALAYHNLALTHYRLHSYEAALQYGERAIEICHRVFVPNDPQLMACQETLDTIREKL